MSVTLNHMARIRYISYCKDDLWALNPLFVHLYSRVLTKIRLLHLLCITLHNTDPRSHPSNCFLYRKTTPRLWTVRHFKSFQCYTYKPPRFCLDITVHWICIVSWGHTSMTTPSPVAASLMFVGVFTWVKVLVQQFKHAFKILLILQMHVPYV